MYATNCKNDTQSPTASSFDTDYWVLYYILKNIYFVTWMTLQS